MSWPIGVSTGSFYPFQTMERALYTIASEGFKVAELFLQTPSEYTAVYGRRILRAMLASGIRIHSIHLNSRDLDPFAPYAPRRADTDQLFLRSLELANSIGARVINWHGARLAELEAGLDPGTVWNRVERWHQWAADAGLTVTLENVSWCMLRTPEQVREARDRIPSLHFTFDSFQAAESKAAPVDVVAAMRDRIATVHLSDFLSEGPRHLVPGTGSIDWPSLLLALGDAQYRGPLFLELSHLNEECYSQALGEGRRFLEQLIDELNLRLRLT